MRVSIFFILALYVMVKQYGIRFVTVTAHLVQFNYMYHTDLQQQMHVAPAVKTTW